MKHNHFLFRSLFSLALLSGISRVHSAPTPAAPEVDAAAKHTPFITVLFRNWDQWDTDKDGTISVAEIDKVVMDPSVKGDDAAVAGTLKLMSRSKKVVVPPLTRDYFAQYDKDTIAHPHKKTSPADAEAATTDTGTTGGTDGQPVKSNKPINWDLYFSAARGRIAKGGGDWPTPLNLDHAHQGQLGDCYLIATIGSMVVHDPAEVDHLVKPMSDGTYHVTIPGAAPFDLKPLTQSQLVISSTVTNQGEWLAVIEQAVGRYNEIKRGSSDDEGTDTIASGGQISDAMAMLTGHKFNRVHIRTTTARREAEADKTLALLRQDLVAAMHDHHAISGDVTPPVIKPTATSQPASTPATPASKSDTPALTADMLPKIPPNINTKHAYAILGYDADTDVLEVWNPHGQNFIPKGPDGLQNGYTTSHGRFHIPLKDAYSFFSNFVFEMDAPATRPVD